MKKSDAVEYLIQRKGPFQMRLAIALILLAVPNGAQLLIGIFLTYLPPYNCRVPENLLMSPIDITEDGITRNVTLYTTQNTSVEAIMEECSINYINFNKTALQPDDSGILLLPSDQSCDRGWQYHIEEETVSAAMEFNWVCSRAWMGPFLFSVQMFGLMAGSTVGAAIPDRFGRKWPFIITLVLKHLFMFLAGLAPNSFILYTLMSLSFMMTMIQALTGVIIGSETLHDSMRQIVSMTQMGLYSIGYMFLPGLAYFLPNWRWLTSATGIIGFLTCPLLYYIVESPRWLMLKGREEDGIKVLRKIARINKLDDELCKDIFESLDGSSIEMASETKGKLLEDENNNNGGDDNNTKNIEDANNNGLIINMKENNDDDIDDDKFLEDKLYKETDHQVDSEPLTYFDLYKKKCLRYRILCCSFAWCSVNLSYYGSSFNTNELGGNRFMNCFLLGVAEVPALVLCIYLLHKIGGRLSFVFFTSTATIFLLGTALFQSISQPAMLTCAMIAKMLISGSFNVNYAYTGEVFPTLIRNQAYGTCSFISRIASILAPYLLYIGKMYTMSLPYLVMGIVSIFSSVAFYNLPETKGRHIPDTLEDIMTQEREVRSRRTFTCHRRNRRRRDDSKTDDKLAAEEEVSQV